jgi:hypothetical protein
MYSPFYMKFGEYVLQIWWNPKSKKKSPTSFVEDSAGNPPENFMGSLG